MRQLLMAHQARFDRHEHLLNAALHKL
jgi:hypothetical protein